MSVIKVLLVCLLMRLTRSQGGGVTSPPVVPTDYAVPTLPTYDYDFSDYGMDYVQIDSSTCASKVVCEADSDVYQNYPEKSCYCDTMCSLLRDCCPGYTPTEAETPTLPASGLQCLRLESAVQTFGIGVYMVTQCAADWPDDSTKINCEISEETNDTLLTLPVSEPRDNILFRNMYCAYCNNIYDFTFWQIVEKCRQNRDIFECIWELQSPFPKMRFRMCPLGNVIDRCYVSPDDAGKCANSSFSLVYSACNMYRNKHCATCNGVSERGMYCQPDICGDPLPTLIPDPKLSYSFRMMVDFNSGHLHKSDGQIVKVQRCKDNEMYDPVSDKCREILCPSPLVAKKGRCMSNVGGVSENPSSLTNCTLVKLELGEYELKNGSKVRVFSSGKVYSREEFQVSGSDLFICVDTNQTCPDCATPGVMFTFDEVESYLSLVTLIVSLVSLAITFIVYIYFNELLNTPGKILLSLIVSLFLAQLMFLISPSAQGNQDACKAVSVIMHYFFLAAFCWMNIVALDLWMTFSHQFISPGSGSKSIKRFLRFSMYGWLVPLLIVCIALGVDFSDIQEDYVNLKPRYGVGVCWITSRDGLLLFFAGPLAVFKLFDIVAFIFTSVHIIRAKRQGAMARQKTDMCSFFINIKLSLVMGLTWVFAFIANIGHVTALWYLFIVFNCLQGLFIAISFLCTNKVQRLMKNKYEEVSGSKSSTQMTSLTPSNDRK